jgi:hypothetical protein
MKTIDKILSESKKHNAYGAKYKLSPYKINNLLTDDVDWDEIALKCTTNERHEMFGKSVNEVRDIWTKRGDVGKKRGSELDTFIQSKFDNKPYVPTYEDDILTNKLKSFETFFGSIDGMFEYVGSEMWLNLKYKDLGFISCRLDILLSYVKDNKLWLLDWKNNEKITTDNRFRNLHAPLSDVNDSDMAKFTNQLYTYKYIIEEYGVKVDELRIMQITEDKVIPHKKFSYEYSKEKMESIFDTCFKIMRND